MSWRMTVAAAVGTAALLAGWLALRSGQTPSPARCAEPAGSWGGAVYGRGRDSAGYGWSSQGQTAAAVDRALEASGAGRERGPELILVFYSAGHRPEDVLQAASAAGGNRRVFGWSSDLGLIAPDGYHRSEAGMLGVLSAGLGDLRLGLGGAELAEVQTPSDCAELALRRALDDANAGRDWGPPSLVLMSATYDGQEEQYVRALSQAAGGSVPVMGGTAAGTAAEGGKAASVIVGGRVIRRGLGVAVVFSQQRVGWCFRGGFRRTGKAGVVTDSSGRVIREIDGRPALDVYDEWSGGRIKEALRAGRNMNRFTGLYPLCRTVQQDGVVYNLFVHAWPPQDGSNPGALICSASLHKGDVVHFSEGSWNILLNHIGRLPDQARQSMGRPAVRVGLLVCCEAVLNSIPPDQRGQISELMNRSLGAVPWMGMFTWGEQGNFQGAGNFHGNLLTGLTLLPGRASPEGGS